MSQLIGTIYQTCFIVPDLETGIRQWVERLNTGPFLVFENFAFTEKDGSPMPIDVSLALAYSGDSFIELIQLNDGRPNIYSDVAKRGGGFHHIAKLSNDLDASVKETEEAGHPLAFIGFFEPNSGCAYMDCRSTFGGYLEYVQYNEAIGGLLDYMRTSADNWDGTTPTMPFPE